MTCTYKGQSYSVGARVCQAGSLMRCESDGSWFDIGSCEESRDGEVISEDADKIGSKSSDVVKARDEA